MSENTFKIFKGAKSFNHNIKNPPNEVDEQTKQQHWRTSAPCPFPKPTTQLLKLMMQSVILTNLLLLMPRDGAQGECKKGENYAQMHMSSLKSSPVHSKQLKVMTTTSNRLEWKTNTHTHTPLWQFRTNMRRFCRYETRMLLINPESGAPHSGLECVGTTRNQPSGEANMFRSNMIHHVPMLLGSSPIY